MHLCKIGISVLSLRPEKVSVNQGKALSETGLRRRGPMFPPRVANACECSTALPPASRSTWANSRIKKLSPDEPGKQDKAPKWTQVKQVATKSPHPGGSDECCHQ